MLCDNGVRGFDLEVYHPAQTIELYEDNAGGLVITQEGEQYGFDATYLGGGGFEEDAYSLATGDGLPHWRGDIVPVERATRRLVAVWKQDGTFETYRPGHNAFRYINRD
jgi:hypothetical protein